MILLRIYKITNIVNGKVYVGQTSNMRKRATKHFGGETGPYLAAAINKHGRTSFIIETIEDGLTKEQANEREIFWIAEFKSADRKYGYNLNHGGAGQRANRETREKLSASLKGRKPTMLGKHHSDITKAIISEAARGRKQSEESKILKSEKLKGRVFSDEHKAKISAAKSGWKMPQSGKDKLRAIALGRPSPIRGVAKHPDHVRKVVEAKRRNRLAGYAIGDLFAS